MSNLNHTPTPWRVVDAGQYVRIFASKPGQIILSMSNLNLIREIDADRIVECVNAMKGIDSPQKLRETWEVVKKLELDAYQVLNNRHKEAIDLMQEMLHLWHQGLSLSPNCVYPKAVEYLLKQENIEPLKDSSKFRTINTEKHFVLNPDID